MALALLSVVVAAGHTRALDLRIVTAVQSVSSPTLDVLASLLTLPGRADLTAILALALAVVWWRWEGTRGLVPLLLFAGVALEIALKRLVPHPAPPRELWRTIGLLPSFDVGPLMAVAPYAFPSGHLLRVSFLVAVVGARAPRWMALPLSALVVATAATHVYLATHWVSDVTGGLLAGLLMAELGSAVGDPRAPAGARP